MLTDENGNKVWEATYDPFGVAIVDEDPDNNGQTVEMNMRLPGQYYDKETGTYYNYFRDYDPRLGRYIQSDPIGLRGGLNTYGYVRGNPLRYIDPLGLDIYTLFGGAEIPFVGGVNVGIMVSDAPYDVGLFGSVSKPVGGLAKGKATLGAGYDSSCRSNFDGVGFELAGGYKMFGGSVSFDPNSDSNIPTGGTFELGPQLGGEANTTITGSLTARDLGRAIGRLIHGSGGGNIIGE
jgi:RHS repeat-associated protein